MTNAPDHCHKLFEAGWGVQIKYFPDLDRPYIASAFKRGTGDGPPTCGFGCTAIEALNNLTNRVLGLGEYAEENDA